MKRAQIIVTYEDVLEGLHDLGLYDLQDTEDGPVTAVAIKDDPVTKRLAIQLVNIGEELPDGCEPKVIGQSGSGVQAEQFVMGRRRAWSLKVPEEWAGMTETQLTSVPRMINGERVVLLGVERYVNRMGLPLQEGEAIAVREA